MVTSVGPLNCASVPVAFVEPAVVCPANVVTTPAAVILRIRLLFVSATKMLPEASTAIPAGPLNSAAVPVALIIPAMPSPANVVTTPAGVILRMRLVSASATYMLPELSKSKPLGPLSLAPVPVPSSQPLVEPAKVDTTPAAPAATFVGAFGTKPGITVMGLDAGPSPTLFVAYTVTVTLTLFVSPVIVQPVDAPFPVHDCPELAVAVYVVIAEPPFDAG